IDFDKCDHREVSDEWQQANLDRLHRSFTKELGLHQEFHFSDKNWQWLLKGYQSFYQLSGHARH
ncbi:MAG: hypothetical protein OQK51_22415, partial [Kangiellaceae bacterium]|nr:hypothetical protein [Kangiellaceae bacterium]